MNTSNRIKLFFIDYLIMILLVLFISIRIIPLFNKQIEDLMTKFNFFTHEHNKIIHSLLTICLALPINFWIIQPILYKLFKSKTYR